MPKWSPFPFVRISISFAAGVIVSIAFPQISQALLFIITAILIAGYGILFVFRPKFDIRMLSGVVGLAAIFTLGFLHVRISYREAPNSSLMSRLPAVSAYAVNVTQPPVSTDLGWRIQGRIEDVDFSGQWESLRDGIILYFKDSASSAPCSYGDRILLHSRPSPVPPPYNPETFNYRQYLAFRGIHWRDFVQLRDVAKLPPASANPVAAFGFRTRERIRHILEVYIPGHAEFTIAEALLLGIRSDLDPDLKTSYSDAGVMHVLAVSGLHVGILFWILTLLLNPLSKLKQGRILRSAIILLILWFYALITGLVPSVLRAVTMFSFFELGRASYKEANLFNILAVSAFILLLLNPMIIMSAGFQLSYLAVAGILYFYPIIYHRWRPSTVFGDKIWQIVSVSLAAQLVTAPLVLFYFHQFPSWFLLSNLIVVPAAFGAVVLGVSLVALSFLPVAAQVLGLTLGWLIKLMNYWVATIQALPGSVVQLHITLGECLLFFLAIFSLVGLFALRRFYYAISAFAAISIAGGIRQFYYYKFHQQPQLVVYRIPGHSAIDLYRKDLCFAMQDARIEKSTLAYEVDPMRLARSPVRVKQITAESFCRLIPGGAIFSCRNVNLLRLSKKPLEPLPHMTVDYLIISHDAIQGLDDICNRIHVKMLVLDSSNSYTTIRRLEQEARKRAISVFSVLEKGAFVKTL